MSVQFTEKGVVALVTLGVCLTLILCGKDTVVGYSLLAVVVGYFGIEVAPWPQIRRKRRGE